MKRWALMLTGGALLVLALCGPAHAGEPRSPKSQKLCPILNEPINKDLFVDHDGKRIYVCCPHCRDKVRENPKKYTRQLEAEGITLENVPQGK